MEQILLHKSSNLFDLYFIESCQSTQLWCKESLTHPDFLARNKPFALFTNHQTNGKGQFDRHWSSEPNKNATFTLVIPLMNQANLVLSNKRITLAIREFLAVHLTNVPVCIKWPNDLYVHGRKIAGLLMEVVSHHNSQFLVLGVGINVNQTKWKLPDSNPISMAEVTAQELNIENFVPQIIETILDDFYSNYNPEQVHKTYNANLLNLNGLVEIDDGNSPKYTAIVLGVDEHGRFDVYSEMFGNQSFHHGQVIIRLI